MTDYARGSEWRRWDLHIHSPYSALNNQFGANFDAYARELLQRAQVRQVAAVGITDYFSVSGYEHLRRLIADEEWLATLPQEVAEHARSLLVLANVELRGFIIGGDDRRDSRVNYHVIFSDELTGEDLRLHFLGQLQFTASAAPARTGERWALTEANLIQLGTRLRQQHPAFDRPPLEVGMMTAVVDHDDAIRVLNDQPSRFEGKYLLVAPVDEDLADLRWDGQGHLARKLFIQQAHMLFSSNPGTREFALGRRHANLDAYLQEFASQKPCIHGSDARSAEALFEPAERRYNWIKSDPTWRGLAMVLNEPEDRVYIGLRPPQLDAITSRTAMTIDSISISRTADATTHEQWFANSVPLNPGTAAIIGNRGSGKSALAEIVALVGDTKRLESFSFLTNERFRSPRIGKAAQFEAAIAWRDGTRQGPRRLSQNPDSTAVERVRYIGQGFLEEICNEMDRGEDSRFYQELQDVIFSHVSSADRGDHPTLASLLIELGEGIAQSIAVLHEDIRNLNRRIVEMGGRLEPEFRAGVQAQLTEVLRQLAAHEASRPPEVPALEPESPEQAALREQLDALRAEIHNQRLVDVLEGTKPAFSARAAKYLLR